MKLEQSFEVEAPLERVWAALVDVERVAPCLPGASVTGRNDDGTYNGTFTIKIGPTTASYAGKLEMQNIDEATHSATMHAQGSDKRGQGGATATIVSRLTPGDGQTRVEVVTDYHITGRLARFGRGGMIEDISERLLRDFARCLQSSLGSDGGAGAVDQAGGAGAAGEAVGHGAGGPAAAGAAAAGEAGSIVPDDEAPTAVHEIVGPDDPAELPPTQAAPPPPPPPTEPEAPPPPTEAVPPPPPPAEPKAPPPPPPTPPHPPSDKSAEPLDGVALVGSILVDRVKRNPKPLVAAAGGLVLIGLLRRRR